MTFAKFLPQSDKLSHIGFIEGMSLPRSARQIDRAGINEQESNIMEKDINRRNMQKHFGVEETALFSRGGGGWRSH